MREGEGDNSPTCVKDRASQRLRATPSQFKTVCVTGKENIFVQHYPDLPSRAW
jgi:hypothetical protein